MGEGRRVEGGVVGGFEGGHVRSVDADSDGEELDVGFDGFAIRGDDGPGGELDRVLEVQSFNLGLETQDDIDAEVTEVGQCAGLEGRGVTRVIDQCLARVDQSHLLIRESVLNLTRQLNSTSPSTNHNNRLGFLKVLTGFVGDSDGLLGRVDSEFGGGWVIGSGAEGEVVKSNGLARGEDDVVVVDLRDGVLDDLVV